MHPTNTQLGSRAYDIDGTVYISATDAQGLKPGDALRLKNLSAITITGVSDGSIDAAAAQGGSAAQVVQWVPGNSYAKCRVTIPMDLLDKDGKLNKDSLKLVDGYIESYASTLSEHEAVQLERFGFCVLDKKEPLEFIFISK